MPTFRSRRDVTAALRATVPTEVDPDLVRRLAAVARSAPGSAPAAAPVRGAGVLGNRLRVAGVALGVATSTAGIAVAAAVLVEPPSSPAPADRSPITVDDRPVPSGEDRGGDRLATPGAHRDGNADDDRRANQDAEEDALGPATTTPDPPQGVTAPVPGRDSEERDADRNHESRERPDPSRDEEPAGETDGPADDTSDDATAESGENVGEDDAETDGSGDDGEPDETPSGDADIESDSDFESDPEAAELDEYAGEESAD